MSPRTIPTIAAGAKTEITPKAKLVRAIRLVLGRTGTKPPPVGSERLSPVKWEGT